MSTESGKAPEDVTIFEEELIERAIIGNDNKCISKKRCRDVYKSKLWSWSIWKSY